MERLFDIVASRFAKKPDYVMLAAKENGAWKTYTAADVWHTAHSLGAGLLSAGIENAILEPEEQEKIGIISPNRPEWLITDIAIQLCGAVITPIYPTVSPADMQFVLQEAGVKKIFVANADLYTRFQQVFSELNLTVYSFDEVPGVTNWKILMKPDSKVEEAVSNRITAQTLATLIYTSGTTGKPKGVMLTHSNIATNVRDSMPAFSFAIEGDKALSFLPLNHIFEKMVSYIYLNAGIGIYYAESMETIGENLKEVQPMIFTTVPRLLEKVYERIMAKALELTGIKRALFFWALNLGKQFDNRKNMGWWYHLQLSIANKLIFTKWREALGGRIKAIVTGSAACQERLIRIFTAANVIIMEGYGLTETSPVVSVNRYESEDRYMGTVGTLIENVEVKIAEDGEILCKGPNIFLGYYKNPEQTAETMQDGWFHTGDIGTMVEGKFLKITDRKKEIFKTSGGKYVAPQPIENKLRESPLIEQVMVVGDGKKFVSALIVPSFLQVRKWLADKGDTLPNSNEDIIKVPAVIALIQQQIDKYNPMFNHVEQIKKFTLLPQEWTIDGGELTPKLSVRRKVVDAKFAKQVEQMYG